MAVFAKIQKVSVHEGFVTKGLTLVSQLINFI